MEYCRGELADVLKERTKFTEDDTKLILKRLATAVAYLHKNGKF